MKQLPKTLCRWNKSELPDEQRKALTKLARDGRARLCYELEDSTQALPHRAVLLHGLEVVGWVLSTYQEFNPDGAGLYSRRMDALVLAKDERSHWYDLPHLCTVETHTDDEGKERKTHEWCRGVCEDITYRFGMVEVLDVSSEYQLGARKVDRTMYAGALLPCEKRWGWELVSLYIAKMRAVSDMRVRHFWNLQANTHSFDIPGGAVSYQLKSICPALCNQFEPPSVSMRRGAVEITIERGGRTLRFYRHNSDCRWTMDGKDTDTAPTTYIHKTYNIGAGGTALVLALAAWESGKAPPDVEDPSQLAAEVADFMAYVQELSIRNRELEFVAKALGLPDPLQASAAPAEAAA